MRSAAVYTPNFEYPLAIRLNRKGMAMTCSKTTVRRSKIQDFRFLILVSILFEVVSHPPNRPPAVSIVIVSREIYGDIFDMCMDARLSALCSSGMEAGAVTGSGNGNARPGELLPPQM